MKGVGLFPTPSCTFFSKHLPQLAARQDGGAQGISTSAGTTVPVSKPGLDISRQALEELQSSCCEGMVGSHPQPRPEWKRKTKRVKLIPPCYNLFHLSAE